MSTLTITIGILAPVITFLIGRYFRSEKIKELAKGLKQVKTEFDTFVRVLKNKLHDTEKELLERERIATKALMELDTLKRNTATVQIVPNINPHHAADIEYIGIYPNNGLEPAHLTREEYQKGVDRLKDNPEDNILTKPIK
jgi:hypothetical protein